MDVERDGRTRRVLRRLGRRPNLGGVVVGTWCWWRSLDPLLLPRSWVAQALVSAVSFAVGYAPGTLLGAAGHAVLGRLDRRPSELVRRRVWTATAVLVALVVVVGLVRWTPRQNDHRELLGMAPRGAGAVVPILLATLLVAAVLAAIGRTVWWGLRAVERRLHRHVPRAAAVAITSVGAVLLAQWLLLDVAGSRFHAWANSAWGALEEDGDDDLDPPTSDVASGSDESLVPWDELGREGRAFVTGATTAEQLADFHGTAWDGDEPGRVYVGLRSADTAAARAELAVRELERTGGFDREVLVVWTVTGTGWVDPAAARALEMLHRGDTAIVAMQYSFLPSWISTLVDGPVAREAGAALFAAVHERWAQLTAASRPTLLVFGLSLGSYGAEAAFTGVDATTSIANLATRTDGALLVGPTNANELWRQLVDEREAGSPAWQPTFGDGATVRFATQRPELLDMDATWVAPRVLYLQHATDPVTYWNWQTMWSRPEWLDGDVGPGVWTGASWTPFVTWAQLVADLSAGFSADPGIGHDYTDAYVAAWAAVAPPDGWTAADTDRLEALLTG